MAAQTNATLNAIIELARRLPGIGDRALVRSWKRELRLAFDDIFVPADDDDSFVVPDDESTEEPGSMSEEESEAEFTPGEEEEEDEDSYDVL